MNEKRTCPKCNLQYRPGYDGTERGCDKCLGVQRDKNNYAWFPNEREKTLQPLDGSPEYIVTRDDAFGVLT